MISLKDSLTLKRLIKLMEDIEAEADRDGKVLKLMPTELTVYNILKYLRKTADWEVKNS